MPTIRRDAVEFLVRCSERYGPIVSFPIPRVPVVLVNEAEAVRRVLQTNHQNYGKRTVQYDSLALVTGEGLLTSDGQAWRSMRRLLQPAFHVSMLGHVVDGVELAATRLTREWSALPADTVVDVDEAMMRTTLQVVAHSLFGDDLADESEELVAAVADALDVVVARAQLPLQPPPWLPSRGNRRLAASLRALDAAVQRLLRVRGEGRPGADVLSLLLEGRANGLVTDRQLRNEVVTLIVAGHETVATTLTWTWHLLTTDATTSSRVRSELASVAPAALDVSAMEQLPVMRAVVDESLRLYPPAWLISRRALAPDVLGGFEIPSGTIVITSPWLVHRDPRLWKDPERFDPDRFLGERRATVDRSGYLPFGAGPRLCIGRDFALLETVLLLAHLVPRFDLTPGNTEPLVHRGVTGRPAGGYPAHVAARP